MTVDPKTIPPVSLSEGPKPPNVPVRKEEQVASTASHTNVWLLRIRALLFVTMCATLGVLLIILPWTSKWTDNALLVSWPDLRPIIGNGFVRGVCSGLGVLDLWLGFWEAIYYHEKTVDGVQ